MKEQLSSFIILSLCLIGSISADGPTPVVLWHGMGDSCCFSFSMGAIKTLLEENIPGVYVHSIRIGKNEIEDVENGYFGNVNEQISEICADLSKNQNLTSGFNAIGFSQGAQFLRAVVQRCSNLKMKNLISIGGQHQGVYGVPNCGSLEHRFCDYLRRMLKYGAYLRFVQEKIVQASYWHDPLKEDEYREKNMFLADINNEINYNQTYKDNLLGLEKLVLVKFDKDSMVTPPDTEWFGFYKPGQSVEILRMEDTDLYKEDKLGLKELNENGKIDLLSVNANHLQFTDEWFTINIINKYLH